MSAIGNASFRQICEVFAREGGDFDTIRLRRVAAHGSHVAFHTDYSRRTIQIALNDDYEGGKYAVY